MQRCPLQYKVYNMHKPEARSEKPEARQCVPDKGSIKPDVGGIAELLAV